MTDRRIGMAIAAVIAVAATGCSSADVADDELVVGTLMPLSGPQEALSNSYRSMQAYFDKLNAKGGIDGVKIKLVVRDDQFNPVNTPAAARELIDGEQARLLCGNQGSGTFNAISSYLAGKRVGSIPMSGESSLFDADTTGYQLLTPYELTAAHLVRHAVDTLGADRIAVAYTDDGIGQPFLHGAQQQLEAMGLKPSAEVQFNASATDQAAAAAKLRASDAEVVLVNHTAPIISQLVRATKRIGYRPQWGLTYATLNKQVLELSGGALDGRAVLATPFPDAQDDSLTEYRAAMTKNFPDVDEADFLSVEGWVVGSLCADVIKRAVEAAGGVPDAGQLLDALNKTAIDNDWVKDLQWTDQDRIGQRQLRVYQVQAGKFVLSDDYRAAPDIDLEK